MPHNNKSHHGCHLDMTCIGHLNIYHLPNKIADVCSLLNQTPKIHLLGLSETWLSSSHTDSILSIPNYQIIRRDKSRQGHTGIAVYINDNINPFVKRRSDLESKEIECIWLEIKYSMSSPLLLGFMYRHPDSKEDWLDDFVQMMVSVPLNGRNLVLLGDINLNMLQPQVVWQSTFTMFGLQQLVDKPTRVSSTSATLLDHIYTNNSTLLTDVDVLEKGISDHFPTICKWKSRTPKIPKNGHSTIVYRTFKHFNKDDFFQDLNLAPFDNIYNCSNPGQALDVFNSTLLPIINKHAPLRKKRVKSITLPGWLTPEIQEAQKQRDQLKSCLKKLYKDNINLLPESTKLAKETEREKVAQEYRKQRNLVTSLVRSSQKSYFSKMITDEKDTASLWKGINKISQKSRSKPCTQYAWSPHSFNDHFLHLAESLLDTSISNNDKTCSDNYHISPALTNFCKSKLPNNISFEIPLLGVHEVGMFITNMKNKKSMGPDGISPSLLKLSLPYVVESLTFIYNLCIKHSVVPQALKTAQVIPLPKSKDISELNNFRPISILSVLTKPFERHIHKHLMEYLEGNNLFYMFQSGFRPHHSCQSALTHLCDSWLSAINQHKLTGAVFLDLKKAFDLVNHAILAKKLSVYLRNPPSQSLLESYLDNRLQYVSSNGGISSTKTVARGVPQGSVLGPLLFCIFINDLPLSIADPLVSCDLFADDTTLHSSAVNIHNVKNSLQNGLDDVSKWCYLNEMLIHPQKTKCMIITSRQKHQLSQLTLNLSIDNIPVEQVNSHKVLGTIIDDQLSWKKHIDSICKKLSCNLYLLNRLKLYVDSDARKIFFNAHCLSHINYASTIWSSTAQDHLKRLNSLYKRATKIILPDPFLSTLEKQESLDILPLDKQLKFNKIIAVFKARHELVPEYITKLLTKSSSRYNFLNYLLPQPRIDMFKASFSFSGSLLWNSLPLNIKSISSLSSFKTKLRNFFWSSLQ